MANLRIRELDTINVGSGGTAADAIYLVVDPATGGTSKVSLEAAVAGTNIIQNAESALGSPIINNKNFSNMQRKAYVSNNLFARETAMFGNLYLSVGRNHGTEELYFSKAKGSTSVSVNYAAQGTPSGSGRVQQDIAISNGTPTDGSPPGGRAPLFISTSGKYRTQLLTMWIYTNGYYISSVTNTAHQFMVWPSA